MKLSLNPPSSLPLRDLRLLASRRSRDSLARRIAQVAAASAVLSGGFALRAAEARADITTEVDVYNNSPYTLTLDAVNNFANQQWLADIGPGNPECLDAPPSSIPPWGSFCVYAHTGFGTNGTGATLVYTANVPSFLGPNGTVTPQSPVVNFTWSSPWTLGWQAWSASADLTTCTGSPFCTTIPQNDVLNTSTDMINAGFVAFYFNQSAPTYQTMQNLGGWSSQAITISGTNFSTHGLSQVYFDGFPAETTCSSSTQCTATAPAGPSLVGGEAAITLQVGGYVVNVGQFDYLPSGPKCVYGSNTAYRASTGSFTAVCTPDSQNDSILIYRKTDSGTWVLADDYPLSSTSASPATFLPSAVGTTYTFAACLEHAEFSAPPQPGCDAPQTVTLAPGFLHFKSF